ncbi:bifunctional DNA-formamidopyrimidine glycosylase/DNA-(apurinic or apyrimidinic site) lyase [Ignatzschineria sp. LJL83]
MPELPEVETVKAGISPHIVGKKVRGVEIHHPTLRYPIPIEIEKIYGEAIEKVERRAKYLIIYTSHYKVLIHLGMSGAIRVLDDEIDLKKHDHFVLQMEGDKKLVYNDPRRFGFILLYGKDEVIPFLEKLAPEPLSDEFTAEYLFPKLKTRTRPIKSLLMDQEFVVGAGNIYANESLFMAGIHPERPANNLTMDDVEKLVFEVKKVLARAIEQGGTTLKDFTTPDGSPGYFAQELLVYGQKGQPCVICDTLIERIVLGNRATYFCTKCQN